MLQCAGADRRRRPRLAYISSMGKLSDKRLRFAREYVKDLNGAAAARRAGYAERTASAQASRLLKNVNVRHEIDDLLRRRRQRADISAERVVKELSRLAFSDMREFVAFGPDGVVIRPSGELSDAAAAAVSQVSEQSSAKGRQVRFSLHDKCRAIELLGRHLNLWKNDVQLASDGPLQIQFSVNVVEPDK